ncbi:endonuclease/exonuclease/phosphatase family protein [Salipiger mangrovisoli]|uniref:Endonuclease/exonuclease/phosphatase family protein n=1 Tax=Salipiger mangrovisoli TaxID=2865933 RepID=A0ABR9X1S7_9RHOB|nr:endonuclease/exonuclease/phosphatase family protein [Salipiger mangrovisoli]MBE9637525.1 endonuclease/exonuclease/phosphatase family protein [Salipiger mangrovisoli]
MGLLWLLAAAPPTAAQELTFATWHADFSRKGPGLLLRDLAELRAPLPAALDALATADADVLLLTDMDFDLGLAALTELAARLAERGAPYPHRLALPPNSGLDSGADLDGDGQLGGPRDAQGYGAFTGQHGMALLSRHPLALVEDFSQLLWRDLPGSRMRSEDPAADLQRLSSTGHWAVRLETGGAPLLLLCLAATPPVFDGPEDRNGRRNADEIALWSRYLDGALGPPPAAPYLLIGNANLDPTQGEGLHDEIRELLRDPRLQDPLPGDPTADWPSTGPMRVSYILPSAGLQVSSARVRAPLEGQAHRLVSVTLSLP